MAKQRKIKHYRYGYSSKRQRRSRFFKGLFFALLLALLVFLGYCGTRAVKNLMNRPKGPSEPTSQTESLPPESSDSSLPEESSEPEPEPTVLPIRAVAVPKESMTSPDAVSAFLDTVDKERYNCVAVELKDKTGVLYYQSAVELAATCEAISPNAFDAAALAALIREKGFTPAARIYALEDDIASHASYNTSYLYQNQDITWLDRAADQGGRSWLNPYMPATVEYLSDLTQEITAAGFEELFVCSIQYPDSRYRTEMGLGPNQNSMTATEALQNVLDRMTAAAAVSGGSVIPVFRGEGYLEEENLFYSANANFFQSQQLSPILTAGQESEILATVAASKDTLIPSLTSEDQLPLLTSAGIEQYLIG